MIVTIKTELNQLAIGQVGSALSDLGIPNVDATLVDAPVLVGRRLVLEATKREHTVGVLCVVRRVGRKVATVDDQLFVVACPSYLMLDVAIDVGLARQLELVACQRAAIDCRGASLGQFDFQRNLKINPRK